MRNIALLRDIKAWHKAFLVSQKQDKADEVETRPTVPSKTLTMPEIVTDNSQISNHVTHKQLNLDALSEHFCDRGEIDKGAWITNYINTSCAEHLPNL